MEESPAASLSDVLNWRSLRWNDGCTYEGLEARGACESHGVVTWPGRRERYEGQLVGSRPHGHGAYRWRDGTLYRGEWYAGHMHGCGVLIWRDAQGEVQAQAGKFYYVGAVSGCTAEDAHEAALEADTAAARARSFEAQRRAGAPAATSAGTAAPMRSGAFPASAAISTSLPPSRPGLPSSSSGWQQRSLSGSAASSWGGGAAGGGGSASAGRRYTMLSRKSLVYATRGRALHQLMPHGVTRQLAGNDEPLASVAAANSAAAAASANDSASDDPDSAVAMSSGGGGGGGGRSAGRGVPQEEELRYGMGAGGGMDAGVNPCLMWPGAYSFMPFTNIQAVAADPDGSGNIYVLDGVSGSSTTLKVLRGDGQLDTLAVGLRIGPKGSGRWPRLAALPGRRLIIYGVSQHDLMVLQL